MLNNTPIECVPCWMILCYNFMTLCYNHNCQKINNEKRSEKVQVGNAVRLSEVADVTGNTFESVLPIPKHWIVVWKVRYSMVSEQVNTHKQTQNERERVPLIYRTDLHVPQWPIALFPPRYFFPEKLSVSRSIFKLQPTQSVTVTQTVRVGRPLKIVGLGKR